jgi:hypothetical protein
VVRPPRQPRVTTGRVAAAVLSLALLAGATAGAAVAVQATDTATTTTPTTTPTRTPSPACDATDRVPAPALGDDVVDRYVATVDEGTVTDWDGGRIARVGAGGGGCSLAVTAGDRATLTATTLNGSGGVLTATVDVGANGSVRFVPVAPANGSDDGTDPPTATGTASDDDTAASVNGNGDGNGSDLVVATDGPDFATEVVLSAGPRTERVRLPTGRFFALRVALGDGTARVAVWAPADEPWDGEWDAQFETDAVDRRVTLEGRAFLESIAVGTRPPATSTPTATARDAAVDAGEADTPTDTPDVFDRVDPDDADRGVERPPERESDDGGNVFFGLVLVVFGAVGAKFARGVARFNEQLDAIGSTTPASEVEPAGWNVALTRLGGVVVAAIGAWMLLTGLL